MLRKIAVAAASKPAIEIKQEGDTFYIKTSTTVRTTEINFKIGEEFEEQTVDGRPCKVRCGEGPLSVSAPTCHASQCVAFPESSLSLGSVGCWKEVLALTMSSTHLTSGLLQSLVKWESENKMVCEQRLLKGEGPKTSWTRELTNDGELILVSLALPHPLGTSTAFCQAPGCSIFKSRCGHCPQASDGIVWKC